jgi:hypothetical protein
MKGPEIDPWGTTHVTVSQLEKPSFWDTIYELSVEMSSTSVNGECSKHMHIICRQLGLSKLMRTLALNVVQIKCAATGEV